jgi:hypothetical protein
MTVVLQNRLPPNCQFEVDDYEANWTYSHQFDYIHGRELAGAVTHFGRLSQQAFENLTSGGYFELQSLRIEVFADDDSLDKAPFTKQMVELVQEAARKFGNQWPIWTSGQTSLRSPVSQTWCAKLRKFPLVLGQKIQS